MTCGGGSGAAKPPRPGPEHEMMRAGKQDSPGRTGRYVMSESGEPASQALPSSDAELIKAVASGTAAAYATLHERHIAAARILARQVAPSAAEAEEVLSETFARLHGVLRRGEGPAEALRPFLLTAVRRGARRGLAPLPPPGGGAGGAGAKRARRSGAR